MPSGQVVWHRFDVRNVGGVDGRHDVQLVWVTEQDWHGEVHGWHTFDIPI